MTTRSGYCRNCKQLGTIDVRSEICSACAVKETNKPKPEPATEYEITRRALEIAVNDINAAPLARKVKTGDINDYIDLAAKELESE